MDLNLIMGINLNLLGINLNHNDLKSKVLGIDLNLIMYFFTLNLANNA